MTVALVGGLLAFAAAPAQAAPPFATQNFHPDDTSYAGAVGNVLSDRFDGTNSTAHLTNVSTPDADRVKWFACNNTTPAVPTQAQLASNCTVVIGEDTSPRTPTGGNQFAPVDEAYDIEWDIPGSLDGATVDIVVLACIGAGDDIEGADANCRVDREDNILLEDAQTGTASSQTTAGEMYQLCTADVDGGPAAGATNVCQNAGPGQGTQAEVDARFGTFFHGMNVPNDGFVFRATTSDDVTDLWWILDGQADAQSDVGQIFSQAACTSFQTGANFKRWECVLNDAAVPNDSELAVGIFENAGGVGGCAAVLCVLDQHYIVSGARNPTTAVASFNNAYATAGSPSATAGCDEGDTPDKDETNPVPSGSSGERIEGCLNDQFGNDLGAGSPVTFESAGPSGTGFSSCDFSGATGTGAQPRLHDHDADGRFEHCHTTTDSQGMAFVDIVSFTDFAETAGPGDQVVTFCADPQFSTTAAPTAQPTGHGCADTSIKDSVTKHWVSRPTHVHLVFAGTGDPADPCHSGDTNKENNVGDEDDLLVCTMDGQDNPATTAQTQGGRLQWFIEPSGGGELTATRFAGSPPSETGTDGRATATIQAFRPGNDRIEVELTADDGTFLNDAVVQKRVTGSGQETACSDGVDNDGDGQVDLNDPGCSSSQDDSEANGGGGGGGCNVIVGTSGADVLVGTPGADCIRGRGGADLLKGRGGADLLKGGRGRDRLRGGAGNDTLSGGRGNDRLNGGSGSDSCFGGPGRDTLLNCE